MTREEAIEILENGEWWDELTEWYMIVHPERDKLHEAVDMAISTLRAQQKSNDPLNGWISVKERLPAEKSGKVLMTDGKKHYIAPREWMHKINGAGGIYIPANHGAGAKITHWMPLPEPPKEGTT